jgi:nitrate reductase NapE component
MNFMGALGWTWDRIRQFTGFMGRHAGAIWPTVAFALLIAAGLIVLWTEAGCPSPASEKDGEGARRVTTILLFLWIGWIYAWVIHCFSGDAYEQRTRSIQFAYFFVILSFVAVSIMVANIDRASSFGVVEGCVDSAEETSFLPIRCDYPLRLRIASQDRPTVQAAAATFVAEPTFAQRTANAAANHNYHHLLNIGGRVDDITASGGKEAEKTGCPGKMIHGGIPVPIYFILLALIGAAISLARNVPVIQRRSEDGYVSTAAEPRLSPGEVRELLTFQILQFVSAPFLAVAAYHTLKPESLATTVALGFLTGFASEKILSLLSVRIKDMKDTPEAPAILAGQIYGKVKFADKGVSGATVAIDGLDKVKPAMTDKNGGFKLFPIPVSPQPYRLSVEGKNGDGKPVNGTLEVPLKAPTEFNAGDIMLQLKEPAG